MRVWMMFLLLACTCSAAHAEKFTAKVIAVLDGDTVLILRGTQKIKIRLAEIDAPEVAHAGVGDRSPTPQMGQAGMGGKPPNSQKAQAFGKDSARSLSGMVLGKRVQVNSQATDQYGRMVAHLGINGLDVNAEQIRRGMAWEYSNYHSDKALVALQEEARAASRGLWAEGDPTPPWIWRKQHPNAAPAQAAAVSPGRAQTTSPGPSCGDKKRCSEMVSCAEARHYFTACAIKSLDGDGDGTPCEKLCGAEKK